MLQMPEAYLGLAGPLWVIIGGIARGRAGMADHSGSSMDMPEAARAWLDHSGSSMDMPEAARAWLDHSGSSRICQRPRAWLDLPRSVIQAASSHAEPGWTVRVHHRETKVADALPCRWTQAATALLSWEKGRRWERRAPPWK
jgi:hypothetical protein